MRRCYVIAEIGLSHKGKAADAIRAINRFAEAGADAIKFQDHRWQVVPPGQPHPSPHVTMTRGEWYLKTQFDDIEWRALRDMCDLQGVDYICSPFSVEALRRQVELKPRYIKIASGEVTNRELLVLALESGIEILISDGMSTEEELARVDVAETLFWNWLTCTSEYPCVPEHSRLDLQSDAYSDHTTGIWFPIAAVARGATMIEKHAALTREGHSDADVCLLPDEFRQMVEGIRNVEKALYEPSEPDLTAIRSVYLHAP